MIDYRELARADAAGAGIDPGIFTRQIDQESGFQVDVTSPAGARGIAQIVPRFHPEVDPTDPVASLKWAAATDRQLLDKYGGRWDLALAAYNAGEGAVAQYGGVPPYPETQAYVKSILGASSVAAAEAPSAPVHPSDAAAGTAAAPPFPVFPVIPAISLPAVTLIPGKLAGAAPGRIAGAAIDRVFPTVFVLLLVVLVVLFVLEVAS